MVRNNELAVAVKVSENSEGLTSCVVKPAFFLSDFFSDIPYPKYCIILEESCS